MVDLNQIAEAVEFYGNGESLNKHTKALYDLGKAVIELKKVKSERELTGREFYVSKEVEDLVRLVDYCNKFGNLDGVINEIRRKGVI